MKSIRLLLADDHSLVRAGIRSLLESLGGYDIVAEARDGHEAVAQVLAYRPDVVLMDIAMPGLNGVEATARIRESLPDARIIILSMHTDREVVQGALRQGAAGYLLKGATTHELESAIASVMKGLPYLSPAISGVMLGIVAEPKAAHGEDILTNRQREILKLVAEGCTSRQIAAKLDIAEKTVQSHRAALMQRLDVANVAGLVRHAVRLGLIEGK